MTIPTLPEGDPTRGSPPTSLPASTRAVPSPWRCRCHVTANACPFGTLVRRVPRSAWWKVSTPAPERTSVRWPSFPIVAGAPDKTQHDSGKIFDIPEGIGYHVAYLAIDAAIRGCGIQSFCNEHGIGELTNGRWRVVNQACMVGTRKAKTELNAKFCQ